MTLFGNWVGLRSRERERERERVVYVVGECMEKRGIITRTPTKQR